jgi:hypothetical protein
VSLLVVCALAAVLIFHNFAMPLLPEVHRALVPAEIEPESPGGASLAYVVSVAASSGDLPNDFRSRTELFEDGIQLLSKHADPAGIRSLGKGRYLDQDGRLLFSASDNSDPRKNGKDYDLYYPVAYGRTIGYAAVLVFLGAVAGLHALHRRRPPPVPAAPRPAGRFKWHVAASALTLLIGLYCSTGTLAPYGDTGNPSYTPPHNYLFNGDHVHFQALFAFVDGQPRAVWNGAIFLRRILFPVLSYPFMKLWGFETGGTIGSIVLNVAGFVAFLLILRRQVGERGATLAAWLLALYPGATYWGGLPYVYSIIFPASLLLGAALFALQRADRLSRIVWISFLMGVAYLGYDLIIFFLPASLFVLLVGRRKPGAAAVSVLCQVAPLLGWLAVMRYGLNQSLENSNSTSYHMVLDAYQHFFTQAHWRQATEAVPDIALSVFFGANFLFLPALFLGLLPINAVTSRIRLHPAEAALFASALLIFLFNNLAPPYVGPWQMRGIWISRLYQPVFPAFIYFAARWFQALPPLRRPAWIGIGAALLVISIGNFLIVFGPILDNPLHVSEEAFYHFYDHAGHSTYETLLTRFGRRPLGF